jgi:hypothetical protein
MLAVKRWQALATDTRSERLIADRSRTRGGHLMGTAPSWHDKVGRFGGPSCVSTKHEAVFVRGASYKSPEEMVPGAIEGRA